MNNLSQRLAQWFLLVAKRLDSEIVVERYKHIENYEPKKIGLSVSITKKDVKQFRKNEKDNISLRSARALVVSKAKQKIQQDILEAVGRNRLIEYDVRKEGDGFIVSGELKVNIPCQ